MKNLIKNQSPAERTRTRSLSSRAEEVLQMSNSSEHQSSGNKLAVKGSEVFVGGLSRSLTEEKIREVFSTCGEILEIRLIKDHQGYLKGFCFVRFATKSAADKAVREKSGLLLDGKKIGVLPSSEQDTLFMGNLYKGWTAADFILLVREVFADIVSVDLATPSSTGQSPPGQKKQNRGFAFVKFSSHAAAARALRAASSPEFSLGGKVHPAVDWAQEDPEVNPEELAKVTIAFIRNLPGGADENFLKKLFVPFGQVEKVIISTKTRSPVGFVHFAQRSELDDAIREMNGKTVQGPNGGPPVKLSIEVARPMEKSRKRECEEPQSKQPNKVLVHSKLVRSDPAMKFVGLEDTALQEAIAVDPYEAAVFPLPATVKERLLRILRLGIATRFDIHIECLRSLKELPESTAISVLDQFMISGAEKDNKEAYLTALISKHQVPKLGLVGLYGIPSSSSRVRDISTKDSELSSFSSRAQYPAFDESTSSHLEFTATRSDGYPSRYSYLYSDYPFPNRASDYPLPSRASDNPLPMRSSDYPLPIRASHYPLPIRASDYPLPIQASDSPLPSGASDNALPNRASYGKLQEASRASSHLTPGFSSPYGKIGLESQVTAATNRQPVRPQMRFDPFTGEPYKFDPFTGEPIRPESPQRHFRSPY
ncbi:putative RNA-binding protein 46 [Heracleum sosnowskyi]|uniref:RNA-binding protein 46 n=1 Tax=Heracleum sosnowskyi TaxID=360622 RepID=A0AAD8IE70_9APIA|nr:putative RNA-binding protein 46 [Heracleum sosnowskyi]